MLEGSDIKSTHCHDSIEDPVEQEPKVPIISIIPGNTVDSNKDWYHGFHVMKKITKGDCVNNN